jgi:hypothetical protein
MKAIIKTQNQNGKNYAGDKEVVGTWNVVGKIKGELRDIVTARCYMGRSSSASVVYGSIWVHGDDIYCAGSGSAGGYGYHKPSAALAEAIDKAGIELYGSPYEPRRWDGNEKRVLTDQEMAAQKRKSDKTRCHIGGVGDSAIEAALLAIAKAAGAKGKLLIVRN